MVARMLPMLSNSYIFLRGLRFHAYHGVLEQERAVGNDYTVDVRIAYPIDRAMDSDDVKDTINYAEVFGIIREEMNIPSQLLEHVLGRIGERLFREFPAIESVDLTLTKLNPPMGADCGGAGVEAHFCKNSKMQ